MSGKKKLFPCGHRGKGKFCHRCKEEGHLKLESRRIKEEWKETLSRAPVQLNDLPRDVAEKSLMVIQGIETGKSHIEFKGKRLVAMGKRGVISIPIARKYRMVCTDKGGMLKYIEVISHEIYNNRISSGGWS